jgi:hypothetical protein
LLATEPSLIPVSPRILCSLAVFRERSLICVLRYRVRLRSVRIGLGGTRASLTFLVAMSVVIVGFLGG